MMETVVCIALICMGGLGAIATAAPAAGSMGEQCRLRSGEILTALEKGDYIAATGYFDARMHAGLSAEKLGRVWHDMLPAKVGALKSAGATKVTERAGGALAQTPLQFANAWLNLRVACNEDGMVGGLFFVPGSAPNAALTPLPAAADVVERSLAVTSPIGPLPGTLTLPKGLGPFPAVLLVAGSGPNDRDETIGPNKPFLDLANGLAAHGIATFRYDKRTHVYGEKMIGKAMTVDDEVTNDAVTAAKLLAQQPHIDAMRVFVLGHSLGALMAPRIAQRNPNLAGVILMAAPVTFDLDTVLRQTRYIEHLHGASAQQIDTATAAIVAARDALANADPAHPPAGELFHAPASYWLSLRDYHAIAVAEKLPQPMLILQGERDYQVTPKGDFAQWQAAFAQKPRVTLIEFPDFGHLFMPAGDPPSPADYAKAGHVDAHVIDAIAHWIAGVPHAK
ncbi:MAG: alpha/beta fold hydrolase [Rudaea sp.]